MRKVDRSMLVRQAIMAGSVGRVAVPGSSTATPAAPQSAAALITARVRTFRRYAPMRERWPTVTLAETYVRAVKERNIIYVSLSSGI